MTIINHRFKISTFDFFGLKLPKSVTKAKNIGIFSKVSVLVIF